MLRSTNEIRLQFTQAMSEMYQLEVPLYKKLMLLAHDVNHANLENLGPNQVPLLHLEHHGAIRVGQPSELAMVRRMLNVMGMQAVDYYDLNISGIPVHSTAFRALDKDDLAVSPFRVFCSLLRLDLIENLTLRQQANEILNKRQAFPEELLKLIEISEKKGGLSSMEANNFIESALEVFRWHKKATVDKQTYEDLKDAHGLVADIVSFKGPHFNHLTPTVLDIDACQAQLSVHDIKAKAVVEGPPRRACPILLRQTSFIAIAEDIIFSDGEAGAHTARFGEVEQRGIALTPKGRKLYDQLLIDAKNADANIDYSQRLKQAFKVFPDSYAKIRQQQLGYFYYSAVTEKIQIDLSQNNKSPDLEMLIAAGIIAVTPITYEDFLPVSAAGIFTSNLSSKVNQSSDLKTLLQDNGASNRSNFESALGAKVIDSFKLYEAAQKESLTSTLRCLGFDS